MEEIHDRLRQARIDAGFEDARAASRAFGWNDVTYRAHENGTRGLKTTVAARYARAFKISQAWLLTGEGARDSKTAEVINIWEHIPERNRDAALQMLKGLSDKDKA